MESKVSISIANRMLYKHRKTDAWRLSACLDHQTTKTALLLMQRVVYIVSLKCTRMKQFNRLAIVKCVLWCVFVTARTVSAGDIYQRISELYKSPKAMSHSKLFKWMRPFKDGRKKMNRDQADHQSSNKVLLLSWTKIGLSQI